MNVAVANDDYADCVLRELFDLSDIIIIRLVAKLQPNIRFTLRGNLAVFTRSAESEPIWIKFGAFWAHCWGLDLAEFWRDRRRGESLRGRRIFFFW